MLLRTCFDPTVMQSIKIRRSYDYFVKITFQTDSSHKLMRGTCCRLSTLMGTLSPFIEKFHHICPGLCTYLNIDNPCQLMCAVQAMPLIAGCHELLMYQ